MGNFGEEWTFIDIISVLSFIIGLQNLELNEKQVRDLDNHLKEQDENQLAKIIQQNEELIALDKRYCAIYSIMQREVCYGYPTKTRPFGCVRAGSH